MSRKTAVHTKPNSRIRLRLFRLTTNYPGQLADFVARWPQCPDWSHAKQHAALMATRFGWSDAWTHVLADLGVEAWEPVANFESGQRAWAAENGIAVKDDWLRTIVAAQVAKFQPDILFVDSVSYFGSGFIAELRRRVPAIKKVVYWYGAPLDDLRDLEPADLLLSNLPGLVDYINRAGGRARLFRHAFDTRVNEELTTNPGDRFPLTFAGSVIQRAQYHMHRAEVLRAVGKSLPLNLFSDTAQSAPSRQPGGRIERWLGPLLARRGYVLETRSAREAAIAQARAEGVERISGVSRPAVYGLDMYGVLQRSTVTLNIHIDYYGESASNMRLFEATGVGACLLTDWKYDLSDQFKPDEEVVTFRSAAECVDKARYLLDNPSVAQSIASAGQRRTLADHTFARRAPELVKLLRA